jgi:hypothetical protein
MIIRRNLETSSNTISSVMIIRRNLDTLNEPADSWPPVKEVENKPRPSFATEDIDALREGSSWLTSDAGSTQIVLLV